MGGPGPELHPEQRDSHRCLVAARIRNCLDRIPLATETCCRNLHYRGSITTEVNCIFNFSCQKSLSFRAGRIPYFRYLVLLGLFFRFSLPCCGQHPRNLLLYGALASAPRECSIGVSLENTIVRNITRKKLLKGHNQLRMTTLNIFKTTMLLMPGWLIRKQSLCILG